MDFDPDSIVAAVEGVVGEAPRPVALHEPCIEGHEWQYVKDCLDSTWVSSVGRYVDEFEARLREYLGVEHVVAVVNGTAALHVALRLAGVRAGDEVLVPALSFVATANAVTYCGAVPHFVDSEEQTLGMDPHALGEYLKGITERKGTAYVNRHTGRRLAAIVPVHVFGHPADLDGLIEVAARFGMAVIEDAAESLGTYYHGRHTGVFGRLGCLSFNGNKLVTTGGGGAIVTDDATLAMEARHLTTTAKLSHRWAFHHDRIGYNYRMPNLNAAMGCAQMEQLDSFVARKRDLADRYQEAFRGISGVRFAREPDGTRSNYWLSTVLLDADVMEERDRVLERGHERGILMRPAWELLADLPMYGVCPRMELKSATVLQRRIINLPSSATLGVDDVTA